MGITLTQQSTGTSGMSVTQLGEQQRTMWDVMPPVTTGKPCKVAINVKLHEFFGISKQQYVGQHQIYGAPPGASPARICYAQVWFRPTDGSTSVSVNFILRHRFRFIFTDVNVLNTNLPTISLSGSRTIAPKDEEGKASKPREHDYVCVCKDH